ncbi:MAG: Maf family protein [Candidatus Ratteibacteria bacterium]|nr:Maf family protein [Candidatus Ratteibacteria bacterium]
MKIILASASAQREELLKTILKEFKIVSADIDENIASEQTDAVKIAEKLALLKAKKVSVQYPGALVIGADTVVELNDILYGKPASDAEAIMFLKKFRGTVQQVITGVAILCKEKNIRLIDSETTLVKMRDDISDEEIEDYVKSGDGKDKAGGYAVQEKGDKFIEWFKGDHYNIVGFPVRTVYAMLKEAKEKWNLEINLTPWIVPISTGLIYNKK